MKTPIIRSIQQNDNPFIAQMIREVLVESGAPKIGTAYEDKTLDQMFETYLGERSQYFVLVENNKIIGSAGIAPLAEEKAEICELQKMYFSAEARGRGLGSEMMKVCLDFARTQNFTQCYLETLPYMKAAQKLYKKTGFIEINHRMGDTGHYSCDVWMLKKLD
ncbi:GNAT family N-acetyltransferase [Mesonia aestuariivivens]|uniref:GNAT family N-acetyltransferase n=1 Tax=Mesonia aestuariivivens TaxID=2796128 RepID=A0ABS6W0X7_9FLAO|nr:GNAT family N-acetyltransferase [Mesonia aestuariivivens]MBW2961202.1 GNAT family N-acetyltransferase [Mesonia aestuariivivens]